MKGQHLYMPTGAISSRVEPTATIGTSGVSLDVHDPFHAEYPGANHRPVCFAHTLENLVRLDSYRFWDQGRQYVFCFCRGCSLLLGIPVDLIGLPPDD